jgi:hypothetical protein
MAAYLSQSGEPKPWAAFSPDYRNIKNFYYSESLPGKIKREILQQMSLMHNRLCMKVANFMDKPSTN